MRRLETFPNLMAMFFARAAEKRDKAFLWHKQDGQWRSLSWADAARQVAALAAGLKALGLAEGERVMLVSENRPEWCIADLAIMAAGLVTVPTYITNTERDHAHILGDSGAAAAIVSRQKLAQALLPAMVGAGRRLHLIGMEPMRTGQAPNIACHNWSDMVAGPGDVGACTADAATVGRDALACLIYTSGTGGAPRGVMQHHGAILHNVAGEVAIISDDFGWGDERFLSFLPLSHALEHSAGQFLPIGLGGEIFYSEGVEKLAANIEETRPTIMIVVPRLLDVLRTRIGAAIEKQGKFPRWLLQKSGELAARELSDTSGIADLPLRLLLGRTLRPKIARRLGGSLKALVSGGAPLNPDVGRFFHGLGVTLLQGYGQTEAAPVISCNRPSAGLRMETVGPPLDAVELRIAEDGEILVRGELVMHGYWRNDEESARALADGWLHTGDIGRIDEAGRLLITDRKKDIIVTDKGDNVAPQRIEAMLTLEPEIGQAMISGDRRPYLVGLVVPDPDWVSVWAEKAGLPNDLAVLRDMPAFQRAVQAAVDRVNAKLSSLEKVRRVAIADEAFDIENQQMTPSLKIRRHAIRAVYGARLDALYAR